MDTADPDAALVRAGGQQDGGSRLEAPQRRFQPGGVSDLDLLRIYR